ncbi:hypothetical protein BaRGS_00028151, partial [Batillaria attramentaria]
MDRRGEIKRNFQSPVLKDTVTVPDGGYAILRFHANNPGVWLLHCHVEYHAEIGMGLVMQVGEAADFPPSPPHFPKCGNWDYDDLDLDFEDEGHLRHPRYTHEIQCAEIRKMWSLSLVVFGVMFAGECFAINRLDEMRDDALPRTCEYDWTLELYYTLSKACFDCPFNLTDCHRPHCVPADGTSRGVLTANRRLPGPTIQVCEGDEIVVNVRNAMGNSEGTTIHWHGLPQRGYQHMDGTNLVTQCPITSYSTFQYRFRANDPGTYWWHSHAGLQRADGLFGSLVIRQTASRDPHSALYDYDLPEHVITVNDWLVEMTTNRFAAHHHDDGDNKPASMLINGMGAFEEFTHPDTGAKVHTPFAEFTVKPSMRYRFRVISAAILNCPLQFSIDNHTLMVIASDGSSFDPIVVDSFNIFAGERFDFVLIADKTTELKNYWIRVRGLADCSVKKSHQEAVLRYEGAPQGLPELSRSYEAGERLGM